MPRKRREPKPPTAVLRLEAFDMHGHLGNQPFDYTGFFRYLAGLDPKKRRERVAKRVIAVPKLDEKDELFRFVAYEGQPGSPYLMFDLDSDSEEVGSVPAGKLLATRTIGVLDPRSRRAVIQFVYSGVRAAQMGTLFEKLAQASASPFRGASFEFAQRAGDSFRKQVASLETIKSAEMQLTRPNYDWNDYTDALTDLAGKSGARNIDVAASAPRDESLAKNSGLVQIIRRLSSGEGTSILKKAVVKGVKEGEDTVTEVKLSRHIESKTVAVTKAADGAPNVDQVLNEATGFLRTSGEQ